jgi:hypothetical protein
MDIKMELKEGELALVTLTDVLVAKKSIMRQIQRKHSINAGEDFEVLGWMDGGSLNQENYHPMALITLESRPYLLSLNPGVWGNAWLTDILKNKPQIILV